MEGGQDAALKAEATYSLWQLTRYMLRLGALGFGGPVALAGYMHRDLVEARHWITDGDYNEGLALAQLMPGPLAAQLAMYLGYVHYRAVGATVVGIAFVLPSFLMVVTLGWAYVRYGGLVWMQAVFYGVGAAVIGIIAMSAYRLTVRTVGKDKLRLSVYVVVATVTVVTENEIAWLFLGAGILVWLCRTPPRWLQRGRLDAADQPQTARLGQLVLGLALRGERYAQRRSARDARGCLRRSTGSSSRAGRLSARRGRCRGGCGGRGGG